MKDFKKMPKMACGGGVKKYEEGGEVLSKTREASRQRMQEKNAKLAKEGKLGELEANSRWVEKNHPEFNRATKSEKLGPVNMTGSMGNTGGKPETANYRSGTGGGGTAGEIKALTNPRAMKRGGKATKKK
jgi:hypothetical protein